VSAPRVFTLTEVGGSKAIQTSFDAIVPGERSSAKRLVHRVLQRCCAELSASSAQHEFVDFHQVLRHEVSIYARTRIYLGRTLTTLRSDLQSAIGGCSANKVAGKSPVQLALVARGSAMPRSSHWPLFDLRIATPRLELSLPDDDDLEELLTVAKSGVHDPAEMPFAIPWTDLSSPVFEQAFLSFHWSCRAGVSPNKWDLNFVVRERATRRIVGSQGLMARNFLGLRTAETGSWLGKAFQRQGIGTEMRRAVLHLAFEGLHAQRITSSAWFDNRSSQRVSITTGYEENGRDMELRRKEVVEKIRYIITSRRWQEFQHADGAGDVQLDGIESALIQLGLEATD
jgi:RimJ/RimL family protein N-acetyltransferase